MDITRVNDLFQWYISSFDQNDEKVKLKVVHTYGVMRCAMEIAMRMGLPMEDRFLAMSIAILHDIGRFEQLKQFDSFEPTTMDHAAYGVKLLFEEKSSLGEPIIRLLWEDDRFDEIVRTAIGQHSLYALEAIEEPRALLHAKLIRDADKLDNCRVKIEEPLEVLLGMTAEEVGAQKISDRI